MAQSYGGMLGAITDAARGGVEGVFRVVLGATSAAAHWPASWLKNRITKNITLLELFLIVVPFSTWSERLTNNQILFWSDNHRVVQALNLGTAHCLDVVRLLQLGDCQLKDNLALRAMHIPGYKKTVADALSHLQWCHFKELAPHPDPVMTLTPKMLWELVNPIQR
ncbi:hypothetical protein NDU88_011244 [Pleurodeles waltl]|uniref:Uncharacterized protein n=1 Tax=Pleurodeles waltl TaxID=8319 RepID=A0AAV7QZH7_PLEWA|nr:hypothetical protein NDU88_011244 [Pleurodeles waltl]